MFGSEKNTVKEAGITLVASNCEVVGDILFNDEVQINGTVEGNIVSRSGSKAMVRISKNGIVKGEIRAPNVIVNGQVIGDIYSSKHIELAVNAQIKGNVYYQLIEMVMGSRVDGSLVHNTEQSKADTAGKSTQGEDGPRARVASVVDAQPSPQATTVQGA